MSSVGGVQTDLAIPSADTATSGPKVVGSLVELGDAHGVERFELTRSSLALKRTFDLGASIMLLAAVPLMLTIAFAIKLDGRGPVFFRQLRVGRHGRHFHMLKFRTMVPNAEALKESLRDRNGAAGGIVQDRRRSPRDPWRAVPAQERAGRAAAAAEHRQGRDGPRRAPSAGDRRGSPDRGLASPAPGADAGNDRTRGRSSAPPACRCARWPRSTTGT